MTEDLEDESDNKKSTFSVPKSWNVPKTLRTEALQIIEAMKGCLARLPVEIQRGERTHEVRIFVLPLNFAMLIQVRETTFDFNIRRMF